MKNRKLSVAATLAAVLLGLTDYPIAATAFLPSATDLPVGHVGQLEMTDYNVSKGNSTVFRGYYEREYWSGNIYAYPVDAHGTISEAAELWEGAGSHVQNQNHDTGRKIATMKDDGSKIPFRWSSLSTTQQASIGNATEGPKILNYVRGDRTYEATGGGTFRNRNPETVLGDVIHSRPYYLANGADPVLFVGANDGMLHAFDGRAGGGGNELWAYVPSMLIGNLNKLAVNPYVHTYFVDGGLNVGSADIGGVSKKVLVSTLGAGGKGLFALDVTTPTATSEADAASKLLWEITPSKINATASASYANLGYTYSTPLIVQLNTAGNPWAVIIGNGYNNTGNGHGVLYVINIADGSRIAALDTGSGSLASPSGLSSPAAIDTNSDGIVDRIYAGDIDGKLWKFDISTADPATWTTSLLHTTSPAQAITMAPSVATHVAGGYMVNFGTGRMFTAGTGSDAVDTSTFYVYGVWDGAPVANAEMLTQTLTEKNYVNGGTTTRVRIVSNNTPNWTSGAANHKGWKVALPAGERIVGDTVFIENGRFYFNATDPTKLHTTPTPNGDNWLMELNYMNGGSADTPFLDLNGDLLLNNNDRIKYVTGDTIPDGKVVGDVVVNASGVIDHTSLPVGKFLSNGVSSHPLLIQLATLNTTLLNQNPDVSIPVPPGEKGVAGGHFDEEIFFADGQPNICNGSTSGGSSPTATITVGTTGSTLPATLGGIQVDGLTIIPALTTANITDGTASTTNATTITSLITGGFSAARSGNVITVSAPSGTTYNGKSFTILAGTSAPGAPGTAPSNGRLVITNVAQNENDVYIKCGSTYITGAPGNISSLDSSRTRRRLDDLYTKIHGQTVNAYTTNCVKITDGSGNTTALDCAISAPPGPSACTSFSTRRITASINTGPSGGSAATGHSDFAPALTTSGLFSGGTNGSFNTSSCSYVSHTHQYDDKYDRTGVNMLNASLSILNLSNAVPSTSTQFKVLVQNQYLSPAVKININNSDYLPDIDHGYIRLKDYATSAPLTADAFAALPTYSRANVGSLVINMPIDAFTPKNWWGDGTAPRSGLHPTPPQCVWESGRASDGLYNHDGNMYQPVNPPANGTDGPGTKGWSTSTTGATATGVRHGGALVVQVIKASTPFSVMEESVPGRPEYGWRVKSAEFENYVLVEWTTFWHHPNGKCYSATGWTFAPPTDSSSSNPSTPAAGSTDPKLGAFGASQGSVSEVTTTSGTAVLTITATSVTITVTTAAGATVTGTVTGMTNAASSQGTKSVNTKVVRVSYLNGAWTEIHTASNGDGTSTIIIINSNGTTETYVIADKAGTITTGGDEKGSQSKTGRISWTELFR